MEDKLSARREELAADLRQAIDDARGLLHDGGEVAGEHAQAARARLKELMAQARHNLEELEHAAMAKAGAAARSADAGVRQHPWESVGIAAGVGLLVGLLIGRR